MKSGLCLVFPILKPIDLKPLARQPTCPRRHSAHLEEQFLYIRFGSHLTDTLLPKKTQAKGELLFGGFLCPSLCPSQKTQAKAPNTDWRSWPISEENPTVWNSRHSPKWSHFGMFNSRHRISLSHYVILIHRTISYWKQSEAETDQVNESHCHFERF